LVFQHYDVNYYTDFLGIKNADAQSVSIVLENMGSLFQTPDGKYINWLNEICENENVGKKNWGGYNFWEKIPDIQMKSTVQLCSKLCDEFGIPKICIDFYQYHKDTINFNGIVFMK